MRIALTIEKVGGRFGGAEKYAAALAAALHGAGHEVSVLARIADRDDLPPGVRVEPIAPTARARVKALRAYDFAAGSARAVRAGGYDLTLGFNKTWEQDVLIAVAGAHRATVAHNRARFRSPVRRAAYSLGKALNPTQATFRRIDRLTFDTRPPFVVAPSRFVADHFRVLHGVPDDRLAVVPNGIALPETPETADQTAARRDRFRQSHGLREEEVAALFLARNYALKGLEPLLHAFAPVAKRCPHAVLIACGSDRDLPFKRLAAGLGIAGRVKFVGPVRDPRDAFAGADLFAFPTFYDPGSLVVPEAQLAGLPVVTTGQNGAGELLTEGVDGFVVDSPWATEQLTDRLDRLFADRDLRRSAGAAAKAGAGRHDIRARMTETLAALAPLTGSPGVQKPFRKAA